MCTPEQFDALQRLWNIANGHSGQSKIVAAFLLGLYNGQRFPFDMTSFRCLDTSIFQDCLNVLVMDFTPREEVHVLLGMSSPRFEQLAKAWRIRARKSA